MSRGWNGNLAVVGEDERDPEHPNEGEATVLPAEEAISLISSSPESGFTPDQESTSEDRSEHFENRDSASSQT